MGTTKVKTDATFGYLKAMGNRQGPHALAADWVGSALGRWFGLSVPDTAIMPLPPSACFDLPRGVRTGPGPAFISRHVNGRTWGGSEAELRTVENRSDITRLIVFDNWMRNCDRHPPDLSMRKPNYANVYLADIERSGRTRIVPIDHTHCFDCGRDFSDRLSHIDQIKDERTYGLFPAFKAFISISELLWSKAMLRALRRDVIAGIEAGIPAEWQVAPPAAEALIAQVYGRAAFIADRIEAGWLQDEQTCLPPAEKPGDV